MFLGFASASSSYESYLDVLARVEHESLSNHSVLQRLSHTRICMYSTRCIVVSVVQHYRSLPRAVQLVQVYATPIWVLEESVLTAF